MDYYENQDELYHYGRKGMKWGQHIFGKVKAGASRVGRKISDIHQQKKAERKAERLRSKPLSKLTDAELKERIERLKLEQSASQMMSAIRTNNSTGEGKKFMSNLKTKIGEGIADAAKATITDYAKKKLFKAFGLSDEMTEEIKSLTEEAKKTKLMADIADNTQKIMNLEARKKKEAAAEANKSGSSNKSKDKSDKEKDTSDKSKDKSDKTKDESNKTKDTTDKSKDNTDNASSSTSSKTGKKSDKRDTSSDEPLNGEVSDSSKSTKNTGSDSKSSSKKSDPISTTFADDDEVSNTSMTTASKTSYYIDGARVLSGLLPSGSTNRLSSGTTTKETSNKYTKAAKTTSRYTEKYRGDVLSLSIQKGIKSVSSNKATSSGARFLAGLLPSGTSSDMDSNHGRSGMSSSGSSFLDELING